MKWITTTLKTILLFSLLFLLSSCNGQNISQGTDSHRDTLTIGKTVSEVGKRIRSIFQDKKGNFWFGSDGEGLYRYDGKNLILFRAKDGLCHQQIRTIQEDKAGNLWFGTGGGVSRFDGRTFTTVTPKKIGSSGSKSGTDWNIEPDDLWFEGDKGGVYRVTGDSMIALQFPKVKLEDEFYARYPNVSYTPYDVYSIYKDRKGSVWFGTSNLGVCRYDGKTFTWVGLDDFEETPVRSIFEDKNGNFWFGNSGQAVYRYDGKSLTNLRKEKGIGQLKDKKADFLVSYMAIVEDDNGELWIGTYDAGLWRYDGKKLTHYSVKDGLPNNAIMTIYKDAKGQLWIGTGGGGVCKFNGKTFTGFTMP